MGNPKYQFHPKVKPIEAIAIAVIILVMLVLSTQVHLEKPLEAKGPLSGVKMDAQTERLIKAIGSQISPGNAVGKIELRKEMPDLTEEIGKPNEGDAAMCKSWSRWRWGDPPKYIEVYESCDPKVDMRKTVQQIRFSGLPFLTTDGISVKSTFPQIEHQFGKFEALTTFTAKADGKEMVVMDKRDRGIAFVMEAKDKQPDPKGKCREIIVYPPNTEPLGTYLKADEWELHPVQ